MYGFDWMMEWCQVTVADLTGATAAAAVCVVSTPAADTPTHTRLPTNGPCRADSSC